MPNENALNNKKMIKDLAEADRKARLPVNTTVMPPRLTSRGIQVQKEEKKISMGLSTNHGL